ncbi:hypothetical protein N7533_007993 [Penicillium manginii]|uniref:uncharacterized protein n=1 Tax=Penicillium manginii TaxID=203109 RepID=UPI0025493AFA|nr:uncharacterized protein N7533_007993 [Penicillium manginii]KAJ5750965.1 hypothetical protein N7533_007993 [Penicillium manginii]
MDWSTRSTIEMNWEDNQRNHYGYHMMDLSQAQPHLFPLVSSDHDWRRNGDARSVATSNSNAISSSQVKPASSEGFDWDTLSSSTDAVNLTSTNFGHPSPNPGLSCSPGTESAFFSHTDRISPGCRSLVFSGQQSCEGNASNNKVHHRPLEIRSHAHLRPTNKGTKRLQPYV